MDKEKLGNIGCITVIIGAIAVVIITQTLEQPEEEKDKFVLVSEHSKAYSNIKIYYSKINAEKEDMMRHARFINYSGMGNLILCYFENQEEIPSELTENFTMDAKYFDKCLGIIMKDSKGDLRWMGPPIKTEDLLQESN